MKHVLALVAVTLIGAFFTPARAGEGDRAQALALLTGADALLQSNSTDTAIELVKRAINLDPTCPPAHLKMGQCLEKANKPRDAFKSYQQASNLAKKENDQKTQRAADDAAKKLGAGLIAIADADRELVARLTKLGADAFAEGQLETARTAYANVLSLAPESVEARTALSEVDTAIAKRGDPVKGKIAAALLSEVIYYHATGNRADAGKWAKELTERFADTPAGKEAAQLLANNFGPPKDDELAALKKEIMSRQRKVASREPAKSATPASTAASTTSARRTDVPANGQNIDVLAMEKLAADEAAKLPKDQLKSAYTQRFTTGKDAFGKAKPGSEGNQKNLATALESFIHCEALYIRIEEQQLLDETIRQQQRDAAMLRYACMKMTVLAH